MEDGLKVSPEQWREQSLKIARTLGYPPATALPIVDEFGGPRPPSQVLDRLLALEGVVAASCGLDRQKVRAWLEKEKIWSALTDEERAFIAQAKGDPETLVARVEAMWALAWTLGIVSELDFSTYCSKQFASMMPDIEKGESSDRFRAGVHPRSFDEVAAACDLSYCLHWAIRQALRTGTNIPGKVHGYVVLQRRRALEWVLSDYSWDDVPMDT